MYHITIRTAKRTASTALKADAWHHRSDALSSVGSLIGIAGARLGFAAADPIAAVVICLFILKAAWDIFSDAAARLTDRACDRCTEDDMRNLILAQNGVLGVDLLHTRRFGAGIYVDVEIRVDGTLSLRNAHDIAEQVHDEIERLFPGVRHCMVHVNPA